MKTVDLVANLKEGEAYYIAIRRPLAPKGTGAIVRFAEFIAHVPGTNTFFFNFLDNDAPLSGAGLKPECIVRMGKTPILDGPEARA